MCVRLRIGPNAFGNPIGLSDPDGLCPFCIVIPGVCAAGGCEVGAAAIVGAGVYAQTKKPPRVEDPTAAAEHKAYKDAYQQPPPPDQDPCERLKWQLAREKALLTARIAWDAKWGAHHSEAITQSMNAIKNIEAKIKNTPGCTSP